MKTTFAKIVSTVFNPFILLGPLQAYLYYSHRLSLLSWSLWATLTIQVGAVFAFILVQMKRDKISDFAVSAKAERKRFVWLVVLCFAFSAGISYFFANRAIFSANLALMLAATLLAIAMTVFNFKASGHLAYDMVILCSLLMLSRYFLIGFTLIPLIAWSRIELKKHTLAETLVGIVFGLVASSVILVIS